jgi:hypothetical protein
MTPTSKTLLTWFGAAAFVACLAVARTGAQNPRDPFIDHSDTGETIHVLPTPASVRSPRDTQPTDFDPSQGTAVFGASYGSGNLNDHGGPEISNAEFQAIYWNASVANSTQTSLGYATLQDQIRSFANAFADGTNWSGQTTDDYTIIQQYGSKNSISSSLPNLTAVVDTKSTQSRISDSGVRSYLTGLFNSGKATANANTIYGVYFPSGMKIALQGGTSCSAFCGYHSHFTYNNQIIKYAVFPYTNCRACSLSGKSVADILTIVTSHEIREAVTDSLGTAWYDASGYEADDKCAWHNLYQMTNGGFWVQPEFSNGGTKTVSGFTATYPGPGCVVPNQTQ